MPLLSMQPKVEITPTLLNDKAFAFLESLLPWASPSNWRNGINAIQAAWELTQAKVVPVVPLLEDAATWQLVLHWATDDSLSFTNFLMEMEKFSSRYQFDKWKSTFDQVFEVSWKGTAVEVVRAAMAECGVVEPSNACNAPPAQASSSCDISHVVLSPQASSLQTCKPMFTFSFGSLTNHSIRQKLMQIPLLSAPSEVSKNEQDKEDKGEDKLDNEVDHCPRVTKVAPPGHMNLTQQLRSLFHCYGGKGSAEGWRVKAHQQGPVCNVKDHMEVDTNQAQPRVFKVMLPSTHSAGFILQHFKLEGLKCKTFHSVPCHIYVEAPSVQDSLKNEITHVQHVKAHLELFDMDLAYQHGLERCNVVPVSLPTPEQIGWFVVLDVDPTLVTCTLTHFSAQMWQVGDHGKIQAGEFVNEVAYVMMDVQAESVAVHLDNPTPQLPESLETLRAWYSMDVPTIFLASCRVLLSYPNQDPHDQLQCHPPVKEHFIEPGDAVCILTRPYRDLTGQVQYFSCSLRQIGVMWHIKKAFNTKDAKGDKGRSKAQVPEVLSKDSDGDGADDEELIIVSLDNIQVTA
ncbi:hypothetical protein F5J12DRAFT_786410 [Pisolithus orientalis]|uniref:uncharacterized protein n=1 Tax=Pisolithus orientalis TaxID=936130 RepID=UPI0022251007|nr:uncharacterized protein F5J12DRAFT_786410 [Pisolithus orientalis]KAI5991077.1 hypothetical protein F5J12DRAFT_786410 [Pisolithus orientalis]